MHECRDDMDIKDIGGRATPGAVAEDDIHGCISAAESMDAESGCARLHGKDCSLQSFCISSIHGGQMQEVRLQGRTITWMWEVE
ncbi:MAG: hypothetical protein HW411_454 [Gammaproteobacteria bacterium]|nr:hypothetical protein [Gammaproteobacteria bacterium]